MINNQNDKLIIKLKDGNLSKAVKDSLRSTIDILLNYYSPDNLNISKNDVTSKTKPELALLKCANMNAEYNEKWLNNLNNIILNNNAPTVLPNAFSKLFPNTTITKTLAKHLFRNLRILLISLWANDIVILSLKHSLPYASRRASEKEKSHAIMSSRHGSKGIYINEDIASDLYTEIMQFVRRPFCNNHKLQRNPIPDLVKFTADGEFIENIHSYIPRILLATDWHSVESVTTEDLNKMAFHFEDMKKKIAMGEAGYLIFPISIKTEFAYYLYSAYGDRCNFDLDLIHHGKSGINIDGLRDEIEKNPSSLVDTEKKEAWLEIEEEYIYNLKKVRKKKTWKHDELTIAKLNKYLFSILPNEKIETPFPSEFDRKYLSRNKSSIPSLYKTIKKRDQISSIQRFFDFLFDVGEIKINPVVDIDKPLESRRTQSAKGKLTITQFRLTFHLGYAIESFIWYVADKIQKNDLSEDLMSKLNHKNTNRVISTEKFGYVPILQFIDTRNRNIKLPLKWIPIYLLNVQSHVLRDNKKCFTPTTGAIHAFLTTLETGLRGIHVRWLERNDLPCIKPESEFFDLVVNTDKVKKSAWIRPTVIRVYDLLKKQASTHSWYKLPWADDCFYYDGHKETDYEQIYPIFLSPSVPSAISDAVVRNTTREIYLLANIIHKGLYGNLMQQHPLDHFHDNDINLGAKEAYDLPSKFWRQTLLHTVHTLRTSVVSAAATILPNNIIGKYITGHSTDEQVSYYTILDTEFIEDTKAMNKAMCNNLDDFEYINAYALAAEKKGAALVEAFKNGNAQDIIDDFGGISFSFERANGEICSGVNVLKKQYSAASVEPTHICPFGNICPPDIIKEGLKNKCGQCWYSVKTIDHLPRILALCHSLSLVLKKLNEKLEYAADNQASDKALSNIEDDMTENASELAAWVVTSEYLSEIHRLMQEKININENITLIRKPDLLKNNIRRKTTSTELESLLVMCDEASNYPEFLSSEFELKVKKVRQQILIKADRMHEALEDYSHQPLIENFRGIVSSICKITGLSLSELDNALKDNKVMVLNHKPTSLMEKRDG